MAKLVVAPDRLTLRKMAIDRGQSSNLLSNRERDAEIVSAFLRLIANDLVKTSLQSGADHAHSEDTGGQDIVAFAADPKEVRAKLKEIRSAGQAGLVLVEPAVHRYLGSLGPAGYTAIRASSAFSTKAVEGATVPLDVIVSSLSGSLEKANVTVYWRWAGTLRNRSALSGKDGTVRMTVPAGLALTVSVEPVDHWPMVAEVADPDQALSLVCPAIKGSTGEAWWRDLVGLKQQNQQAGAGVRIGIVDSGVGPHPHLDHVMLLPPLGEGEHAAHPDSTDLRGHGSHVAGLIGARNPGRMGLAPAAELLAVRVFADKGGCTQQTVSLAVKAMTEAGVHLINLSLGAQTASRIERQEIQIARDAGILCIAAAGNEAGAVQYPAAYPEVYAVAAFGKAGAWEVGSTSAGRMPANAADIASDGVFGANFSCRGREVSAHAPGVAIVSTYANGSLDLRGEAVMDGTSMSAPIATGILADMLSRDPKFLAMPPARARAAAARRILNRSLKATGLPSHSWGQGSPSL